jgi:adenosine deaminase
MSLFAPTTPANTPFSDSPLARKLCAMPKAELHMHIEGSLEPELIFALAERNGVTLPYASVDALRDAYAFTDLQSFLDIYYAGASVLLTEQDFYDMTWAYVERALADHIVHTEIFFDPQTHTARGVPVDVVVNGIARALDDAESRHGLSSRMILCFLRHLPEEDAFATLAAAEACFKTVPRLIGVGLDSSEKGNPPEKFAHVFARCEALGLRRVAHAGEEGPAQNIRDALDLLHAERIDHGVTAIEDQSLLIRLAKEKIALTVCPLSNVKLKVFDDMTAHSLPILLDAGVAVTLNSDDPAYFGGYLNTNYLAVFEALPLGEETAYLLARNSLEAAFATDEEKARWVVQLDAFWAQTAAA